jgi:osmoprotectant transport system ATP-binding protein
VVCPVIEFEGVTKVFPGGTVAVDDVNLVAPTGRTTVLIGPPGCGKTTLLRMVNRMLDPSAGRVSIDGNVNTAVRRSVLRRGIGYVVPGGLFPHRTVIRNIETVPLLLGIGRGDARRIAVGLLERVGLTPAFADKYPAQLSAGQQARVAMARALASDPPILLMDSPFSALDPAVRQDLQDDLLELQRVAPKTILFATHDIDEAIKLGDQIAVMAGGRMVQLATPQTMLAQPGSEYVADLLGRDRGIRKLTFLPAAELPLTPAATIQAGSTGARARSVSDTFGERWLIVLDSERRPRGWVDSRVLTPDQIISGPVVHPLGGSFYADESILAALDAAILAPSGLAVCLDDAGMALGVVNHAEIARYLSTLPPHLWAGPSASSGPAILGIAKPVAPAPTPAEAQGPLPSTAHPAHEPGLPDEFHDLLRDEPMGTTWTTREEPGGSSEPGAEARRSTTVQTPPPVVKEAARHTPVVPTPTPAPVLRPTQSKPATVPTIRGGESTPTPAARPTNGTLDPVTKWLIGGEDPAEGEYSSVSTEATAAASSESTASTDSAETTEADPAPSTATTPKTGAVRWEWSSETGQWLEVPDTAPEAPHDDEDGGR